MPEKRNTLEDGTLRFPLQHPPSLLEEETAFQESPGEVFDLDACEAIPRNFVYQAVG